MIDRLEIHHLRTLDALYRSPSITVAAEHLDLSQQAVSQQLRRLRTITGDRLFISSGHGVVPTPYARRIEPHVRQVLALLQAIPPPDAFAPERVERSVTISATDHAQQLLVAGLLDDLRTHAPGVTLVVVDIESAGLTRCMERGEIDLAFTSRDYLPACREVSEDLRFLHWLHPPPQSFPDAPLQADFGGPRFLHRVHSFSYFTAGSLPVDPHCCGTPEIPFFGSRPYAISRRVVTTVLDLDSVTLYCIRA